MKLKEYRPRLLSAEREPSMVQTGRGHRLVAINDPGTALAATEMVPADLEQIPDSSLPNAQIVHEGGVNPNSDKLGTNHPFDLSLAQPI